MNGPEVHAVEELARSNERLREQQGAISSVLRAVVRSAGLQPVLDEVSKAARRLCVGDYSSLYIAEGDFLLAVSGDGGADQWEYDKHHPHPLDRTTFAGRAAVTRDIVHVPDVIVDREYAYPGPRTGFRAGLGVPVLFEDELIGVLLIVRSEPEPFTVEQIQLVQTFADQAAITIANARLINAVERQRTRLSDLRQGQVAGGPADASADDGDRVTGTVISRNAGDRLAPCAGRSPVSRGGMRPERRAATSGMRRDRVRSVAPAPGMRPARPDGHSSRADFDPIVVQVGYGSRRGA